MLIEFDKMETTVIPYMRGGEKEVSAQMYADSLGKIMRGTLIPGASIGLHTHETSSEIIYILSGTGKVLCDGTYEPLSAGSCHYCPKGHEHSLSNDSEGDLVFFAVVPEQ
ncbi:MAG: cupin domain-containing protein [Dysosmobacter sp.]|uniref:cupin domain-containing protein n=1 Tax=uncultured Oscillibacter sp. TaxID=876091 RepID=UPI0025ED59B1|nr:cupin domain-containing protein [uncultured Oscillibacter sp.]MCX4372314.1 cupin domain-containing protein [Dysosmobacter sp.]